MCLFTKKRKISNNCGKEGFLKRAYIRSTFLAGILHKKHLVNIELLTSVKDCCFWIANKKQPNSRKTYSEIVCFLDSVAFIGYRAEKKTHKNLRLILCPKISKVFFCFLRVFWFLDSEAFIGYRAEQKTKRNLEEN